MKLNLNNFGKNLKFKSKTPQATVPTEEELFIEFVGLLEACWLRSNQAYENFGINLLEFEEDYHQVIENLLLIKYGLWKTEVVLWYIFGRLDEENEVMPLVVKYEEKDDEEVLLMNAKDLWDFLLRMDAQKNQDGEKK